MSLKDLSGFVLTGDSLLLNPNPNPVISEPANYVYLGNDFSFVPSIKVDYESYSFYSNLVELPSNESFVPTTQVEEPSNDEGNAIKEDLVDKMTASNNKTIDKDTTLKTPIVKNSAKPVNIPGGVVPAVKGESPITNEYVLVTSAENTKTAQEKIIEKANLPVVEKTGSEVAIGGDSLNRRLEVSSVARNIPTSTSSSTAYQKIVNVSNDHMKNLKEHIASKDPSKNQVSDKNLKKISPFFLSQDRSTKLFLIKENAPDSVYLASSQFLLEDANEGDSIRNEIISTHGADILNIFGKNVKVWSYSGRTLNGGIGEEIVVGEKDEKDVKKIWYESFNDFLSKSLGQPIYDGKKHRVRLEYQNFIREGYILDYSFSQNSNSSKSVRFSFRMAIKEYYAIPFGT